MNTDNRTNERIETRKCSNQACPLRRAHSGPCAPSDWKPGAPSEAQVEAAAKAMCDLRKLQSDPEWGALEYGVKQEYRKDARAALEAAAGVAPQAPEGRELDALRALIENRARVIEGFSGAPAEVAAEQKAIARSIRRDLEDHDFDFRVAPVQPSSTVDEGKLTQAIYDELMTDDAVSEAWSNGKVMATARRLAKFAVVEAIGGESRGE